MVNNRLPHNESDKKRDNAVFLLPLFGAVFSLPPIMNLFNHKILVFGVPLAFLYLFSIWAIMVVIAVFISHKRNKTSVENAPAPTATNNPSSITGLLSDKDGS